MMVNKDKIWLSKKEYDFLVSLRNNPPNLNKFIEHPDKKDMKSYEYHLLSFPEEINIESKTTVWEATVICKVCGAAINELGFCNECGNCQ